MNYLEQSYENTRDALSRHPRYRALAQRLNQLLVEYVACVDHDSSGRPMINVAGVLMEPGQRPVLRISPLFADCPLPYRVEILAHELYHVILHDGLRPHLVDKYGEHVAWIVTDLVINQMIDIELLSDGTVEWTKNTANIGVFGLPPDLSVNAYAELLTKDPKYKDKLKEELGGYCDEPNSDPTNQPRTSTDGDPDVPDGQPGCVGLVGPATASDPAD